MSAGTEPKRHQLALIITELEPGGAERCLTNLALGIDKQRFSVAVYSLGPRPPSGRAELVEALEAAAIPVHFIDARGVRQVWSAYRSLRNKLREQRPDIVQTFLFHANVLGTYAALAARVPVVIHGVRVADPSKCRELVERWARRHAKCAVCVSRSVAQFVESNDPRVIGHLHIIPNGIDVSRFASATPTDLQVFGVPEGRRVIVFPGRLHPQKGVDWLLEATPEIFRQVPDVDLLIVGDGEQRPMLEAQALELGVNERVHFAGWQQDIPGILAASHLLILPSRWEGMPNAILEGMAARLPVVATRVEGVEELLGPLAEGQTVPFGDSKRLVQSVVSTLTEPQRGKDLGTQNQQRAKAEFSLERMVREYENLYESCLRGR